jgi:hypothetical protein
MRLRAWTLAHHLTGGTEHQPNGTPLWDVFPTYHEGLLLEMWMRWSAPDSDPAGTRRRAP